MEVSTIKTAAVFAVIFGCFALLYPKIFHPMLMYTLGVYPESSNTDDIGKMLPPHLRKPGMEGTSRTVTGGADDSIRHMRQTGPHPGMRAAAEMQKQAGSQGGRGGGIMSIVLPMYAIGIIIYLIYTLSKVFGGNKKQAKEDERYVKRKVDNAMSQVRYNAEKKKFQYGEHDSDGEDDEYYTYRQNKRQQRDLERLLTKADNDKISDLEMRELKRRLLETEAQMTRILSAMESVQENVVDTIQATEAEQVENDMDQYMQQPQQQTQDSRPLRREEGPGSSNLRRLKAQHDDYNDDDQDDACGEEESIPNRDNSQYGYRFSDYEEHDDHAYVPDDGEYGDEQYEEDDQNADMYEDDFEEDSASEIEENIEAEGVDEAGNEGEGDDEDVYVAGSREEGDGEENAGEFDGEFTVESESDDNEPDNFGVNPNVDPLVAPEFRHRTGKGSSDS